MKRREFFEKALLGGAVVRSGSPTGEARAAVAQVADSRPAEMFREGERVIERPVAGRPHAGKVLVAIQPHSDDIPLFAGGTVAKLIREGYSGCLVRMTNDEKAGRGATTGEVVLNNERDNDAVAKAPASQRCSTSITATTAWTTNRARKSAAGSSSCSVSCR